MTGVMRSRDGAVGVLTLSEPASLNAMTPDLLGAAIKLAQRLAAGPTRWSQRAAKFSGA